MGTCIISKSKYSELLKDTINDTYFKPINDIEVGNVVEIFTDLSQIYLPTNYQYLKDMITPNNNMIPEFKGLPKVHKTPVKLRPVVNAKKAYNETLSKHLDSILKQCLDRVKKENHWIIDKSQDFINRIKTINGHIRKADKSSRIHIITFDFDSLYLNIDHNQLYQNISFIIKEFRTREDWQYEYTCSAFKRKRTIDNDSLMRLIQLFIYTQYIVIRKESKTQTYKQIKGVPMGSNCSPTLAILYLAAFEIRFMRSTFLKSLNLQLQHCCRYIDDFIAIIIINKDKESKININTFRNTIYRAQAAISDTTTQPAIFLDSQLTVEYKPYGKITYEIYRKPQNAYQYPHKRSFQPHYIKTGFIIGEILRSRRLNYKTNAFVKDLCFFFKNLYNRGYTGNDIIRTWHNYTRKEKKEFNSNKLMNLKHNLILSKGEYLDILQAAIHTTLKNDPTNANIEALCNDIRIASIKNETMTAHIKNNTV
jgi:phosphopantetheine adenylyltransferase